LEGTNIIHWDFKRTTFKDETLFKEAKVDLEMRESELQKVMRDVNSLVKEEDNI
jgi:hypothetical protein